MDFRSAKYFLRLLQGFVVFGSGWKKDIRGEYNEELLNSKFTMGLNGEEAMLDSRQ
jgi:hypothetical protein